MRLRQLLRRLSQGALNNVRFTEFVSLVEGFGFQLDRIAGSHHFFTNPAIRELLYVQQVRGQAKPYQIRQFLRLVERYNPVLGEEK